METNQQNQLSNFFPTPDGTVKKKRGRPRKDPSQSPAKTAFVPRNRAMDQNHGGSTPVPPGFGEANKSDPQPINAVDDNNMDPMVGQVVTGVIEAVFDAGYLLSVRVGDSDTSLRGVVFKSGQYVPVTAENDLVPGLQMIKRNEVSFPVANQTHKHRHRGRKRSEHHTVYQSNGTLGSSQTALVRDRQLAIVPAQAPIPDPLESRGTLVPVVLRPLNLSNGAMPAVEVRPIASQPAHLSASKGKHNGPIQVIQKCSEAGGGSASRPFEELVTVAKKMKGAPYSAGIRDNRAMPFSNMMTHDSGLTHDLGQDMSKPLFVEPLQTIHSSLSDRSPPMSHAFPERSTGKMTELLMAVQENLMERQMSDKKHQDFRNPEI